MEKIKLLIIDAKDSKEGFLKEIKNVEDIELVGSYEDGNLALNEIKSINPSVAILDLLLPGADGFDCIKEIKKSCPECKIIVTSALNSTSAVQKTIELGVDYFMMKPVDGSSLIKRVREVCEKTKKFVPTSNKELEEKITNIFLTVGIPAHIKGYQFLREAIKMAVSDPHIINSITKKLYPGIAQIYDTTASKVERAIRHAIEVAWNKGKIENINDVFGLRVYDTHEKPTNGEFIALVADKMLLEKY